MTYKEKLDAIRLQMKEEGVAAYVIPSSDPHTSEYLPEYYRCVQFASGFTGSAGTLIITADFAGLWTDFRYFEQAEQELSGSGYELVKLNAQHAPEYINWLKGKLEDQALIGFNDRLVSIALGEHLAKGLEEKQVSFGSFDFLAGIWPNRPPLPMMPSYSIDSKFTGHSVESKLAFLRKAMEDLSVDHHLISSLDDIAWLFNIRGNDVSYNPVTLSFALIGMHGAKLFIHLEKLKDADKQQLNEARVEILPYEAVEDALSTLSAPSRLLIDPKRNCLGLYRMIPATISIVHATNPSTHAKAVKNVVEIEQIRWAMINDGVALVCFFKWLEENKGKETITELTLASKLLEYRHERENFVGPSFSTIAAYRAHGALPHYSANESSNAEILAGGLVLIDSGGQYLYGTTDITRVVPLGNPSDDEKYDYTLVLKAMIDGSKTIYPKGTCGYQIDAICRRPLWEKGINYGHGTGHGVGYFLNVHEGPQVFNQSNIAVALQPGMITSIEPGVYRPGIRGIRIENLVLTVEHAANEFGDFYAFETLTLAPINTDLIIRELLGNSQLDWLNAYHQLVFEKLSPYLSDNERKWLKEKTKAI